jgi:ABC-type transport system involved in multi-copper enzyme maturation permease subunit
MECYNLRHSKAFQILLLISLVFSLTTSVAFAVALSGATGKSGLMGVPMDFVVIFILNAVLACLYIGSDFNHRTINVQVATGHSRLEILLGKSFAYSLATIPLCLIPLAVRSIVYTVNSGWGEVFTTSEALYVFRALGLSALLNIANSTVFVLFAFLFQDTGKSASCSIPFYLIFSMVFNLVGDKIPTAMFFYEHTAYYYSGLAAAPSLLMSDILAMVASGIITIALVTGMTYLLFRKREMK